MKFYKIIFYSISFFLAARQLLLQHTSIVNSFRLTLIDSDSKKPFDVPSYSFL